MLHGTLYCARLWKRSNLQIIRVIKQCNIALLICTQQQQSPGSDQLAAMESDEHSFYYLYFFRASVMCFVWLWYSVNLIILCSVLIALLVIISDFYWFSWMSSRSSFLSVFLLVSSYIACHQDIS